MKNDSALGIFFRVPEYGKVKKRLAIQIGKEKALELYALMLHTTLGNVSCLKKVDIYGFYLGSELLKDSSPERVIYLPQQGNDLGERMINGIRLLFKKDYKKVVLIGADSPDLPIIYIEDAFLKLDLYDLVIGPSEDGGYYLIGMNRPLDAIFKNIKWGSRSVLKDTISITEKEKIKYFLLDEWYDIDDIKGLKKWRNHKF